MNVRDATVADAQACAELHVTCIPTGFLSSLGSRFLTRLYRRAVLDDDALVVVADDGRVAGFAAVALDVSRFYRSFLVHDGVSAAVTALPTLARRAGRALETLRYPSTAPVDLPRAELLAIAVAPPARGSGVATDLLRAAGDAVVARGADRMKTVVGLPNDPARAMYGKAGYAPAATLEVHRGAPSEIWVWTAPSR